MHVRAQSYRLFRRDGWIAGAAIGSGVARIINTASAAHENATLDFDDLQSAKSFGAVKTRGRSKLCNILPVHARTCSPPARHRWDRELSASRFRRHSFR
jgi:hypothetical protein